MSRGRTLPRYESPASVEVGDLIRVAWHVGGVEHTRTGKVYRKISDETSTVFFTEDGQEIFRWMPSGRFQPRLTLLAVEVDHTSTLTSLDELERMLA